MDLEQTSLRATPTATTKYRPGSCPSSYKLRRIRSKGALLIMFWFAMMWSFWSSRGILVPKSFQNDPGLILYQRLIPHLNYVFVYPLAGWLADVKFGRYNVMHTSLWLMWVGALVSAVVSVVQSATSIPIGVSISILVVTNAFMLCGLAGFHVNILPFGTDQLQEASSEEISAFVHWLFWAWNVGNLIGQIVSGPTGLFAKCTSVDQDRELMSWQDTSTLQIILAPFPLLCLTLALSTDYIFRNLLNSEPKSQNPLKTVISVLKYAARHKRPEQRSALTYWEDLPPKRIDFGKTKYGGPFTTEEVEDVKTFLRILAFLLCSGAFLVAANNSAYFFDEGHFQHNPNLSGCLGSIVYQFYTVPFFIVVSIPIYELLIYPFCRRWIPTILKRLGLGIVAALVCSVLLFSVDTAGHAQNRSVPCMFSANMTSPPLSIDATGLTVPFNVFSALFQMLYFIAGYEFICAQSPYRMKGLLFGCYYSMRGIFLLLADIWYIGWKYSIIDERWVVYPSCGFWYYLFTTVMGAVGLVIFCLVAKWYKKREREEPTNERWLVEAYYNKYLS